MNNKLIISILLISTLFSMSSCSLSARIKKADRKYAIGEYY